jgi:hypothetical protein
MNFNGIDEYLNQECLIKFNNNDFSLSDRNCLEQLQNFVNDRLNELNTDLEQYKQKNGTTNQDIQNEMDKFDALFRELEEKIYESVMYENGSDGMYDFVKNEQFKLENLKKESIINKGGKRTRRKTRKHTKMRRHKTNKNKTKMKNKNRRKTLKKSKK